MWILSWDQGSLSYASSLLTGVIEKIPPWVMPFLMQSAKTDYLFKVINCSQVQILHVFWGACLCSLEVVFIELCLSKLWVLESRHSFLNLRKSTAWYGNYKPKFYP